MSNTFFNPKDIYKNKCAPTEIDDYYRYRIIKGEVHDENTYILGGVSGHAGLFSNVSDLSKISKMLLNGGVYLGRSYLKKEILNHFTEKHNITVNSERAIGFDTPSKNSASSAGDYYSDGSYLSLIHI